MLKLDDRYIKIFEDSIYFVKYFRCSITKIKTEKCVCVFTRERESEKAAMVLWYLGYWVAPEKDKKWSESQVF